MSSCCGVDTVGGVPSGGGAPSGPAGGDLGGFYPDPVVTGFQGVPVDAAAPADNDVYQFNIVSGEWEPTALSALGIDHNTLLNLTVGDVHTQYAFLAGRVAGQTLQGSTAVAGELELQGSASVVDQGQVVVLSPLEFRDAFLNTPLQTLFRVQGDHSTGVAPFIGGVMSHSSNTLTVEAAVFIWSFIAEGTIYRQEVSPGFAAFTLFNALPVLSTTNPLFQPVSAIVLNGGPVYENFGAGGAIPAVPTSITVSHATQVRARVAGDAITVTNQTAVQMQPTFSTVAGSTVTLGTVRGLWARNPTVALFQPSAGTELLTSYFAVEVDAIPFGGNVPKAALRSSIAPATLAFFLQNLGGAQSDFGGGFILDAGLVQVLSNTLGLSLGSPGGSLQILWDGTQEVHNPIVGDNLQIGYVANIHTFSSASVSEDSAVNFNYPKGAFGEGGAPGNNKYRFVAGAETVTVGGEFTQFLMTQSANDTLDAAISLYAGWTINAPTPAIGTGSLTTGVALNVGGNPTGTTNRVGVRIISNPAGGAGVNAALWVTAGLTQLDGNTRVGGATTSLVGFYGVAGVARAAAYVVTNPVVRRAYDTTTVTLQELAEVVSTLIADDQATGLRG